MAFREPPPPPAPPPRWYGVVALSSILPACPKSPEDGDAHLWHSDVRSRSSFNEVLFHGLTLPPKKGWAPGIGSATRSSNQKGKWPIIIPKNHLRSRFVRALSDELIARWSLPSPFISRLLKPTGILSPMIRSPGTYPKAASSSATA